LQSTEHPNDSRHANDFLVEDVDDALGCGGGDFPLRDAFPSAKMNVARNGMDMDVAPYRTLRTSTPASTDTCTRDSVATPRTPPCGSISLLAAAARTPRLMVWLEVALNWHISLSTLYYLKGIPRKPYQLS
jgi:hypothetical protein